MQPGSGSSDRGKQLPRGFAPHHLGPPPVRPQMSKPFQGVPYQGQSGQFPMANMGMSRSSIPTQHLPHPMQSPLYRSAGVLPPQVSVGAMRIPPAGIQLKVSIIRLQSDLLSGNAQGNGQRMNSEAPGKLHSSSRMTVPVESFEHDPAAMYDTTASHYGDNFKSNGQGGNQSQYSGTPHPISQGENAESPRSVRGFQSQPNYLNVPGDQMRTHPVSKARERERALPESSEPTDVNRNFRTQSEYSQQVPDPIPDRINTLEFQDSDRIRIRTEADRIAERLLKTEADLERLRRQGDLIGESLRKQKLHDVTTTSLSSSSTAMTLVPSHTEDRGAHAPPPARPRSPLNRQSKVGGDDQMLNVQGLSPVRDRSTNHEIERVAAPSSAPMHNSPLSSPSSEEGRARNFANASPTSSRSELSSFQMMQPAPMPLQTLVNQLSPSRRGGDHASMLSDELNSKDIVAEPPAMAIDHGLKHGVPNKVELAQKQLSAEDCSKLGLPPGTMWFDPNSKAQMKLITDQLNASKAEAAAKAAASAAGAVPQQAEKGDKRFPTGPISSKAYTEEEVRSHFAALSLPESATLSQIFGAYKRSAPRAFAAAEQGGGGFAELISLTESYKCCEAVSSKTSQNRVGSLTTIGEDEEEYPAGVVNERKSQQPPMDFLQMYKAVFHSNIKKGELHVQLGVSLEDLVQGHDANFTYERMVCMEDGSIQPEKCQLHITVAPGMRPGIEFIFDNEGDDAPGHFPGDVRVTLCAEPHVRFFWAGNDLATQITISLASALLGGVIGEIKSITKQIISLSVPKGTVVSQGAVFRVRGEGLPLSQDSRLRGDLFVRMLIEFPKSLDLSVEEKDTVRRLFSQVTSGVNAVHHAAGAEVQKVQQEAEPAAEQEFGKGFPIMHAMACAQQ